MTEVARDGRVFGTFCCFSRRPDRSLGERDLRIMKVFAELVAEHRIEDWEAAELAQELTVGLVRQAYKL